jgi:hypothetical protein
MPEPVSTTIGICWLGYAAVQGVARGGTATSREGQYVCEAASAIVELAERSQALFGTKATSLSRLRSLVNECVEAGWDGGDAAAISPIAALHAEHFIRALPDAIPLPEFSPEPDGSISFDWIRSRSQMFSLSIGESGRIAYAWLDGSDKGHAVAQFDGETVPRRILQGISDTMEVAHASLRAA